MKIICGGKKESQRRLISILKKVALSQKQLTRKRKQMRRDIRANGKREAKMLLNSIVNIQSILIGLFLETLYLQFYMG